MGVCAFSGPGRPRQPRGRHAWSAVLALALALAACAGGAESTTFGQPLGFDDGRGGSSSATDALTDASPKEEDGDEGLDGAGQGGDILPDFGTCTDDADCFSPSVPCWNAQGSCDAGVCVHAPRPAGEPCDDADACTEDDTCDGAGGCVGNELECTGANATPGTCNAGQCQGMTCMPGFGDCNADASDGCETPLTSASDCGACGQSCSAGAHATASCATGTCERSCESPWDNCDGDWANGCEIPVGVPNQCDAGGLNPNGGCWTAYCGNSAGSGVVNFGTFFCADCATCHVPSSGMCQWCNHSTGTWYPQDSCACGGYLDLVCTP